MSNAARTGCVIIGIGHAERRDDGVGPYVARRLGDLGLPAVVHEGDGAGLLELWDGCSLCIAIDAISESGGKLASGTLQVFGDLDDPALAQARFVHSSHRLGLPEAIALGKALGRLPGRLVVIGIVGADFGFGRELSPSVRLAAERLIEHLAGAQDAIVEDTLDDLHPIWALAELEPGDL